MKRLIGVIAACGFFVFTLSESFHHHAKSFESQNCSFCVLRAQAQFKQAPAPSIAVCRTPVQFDLIVEAPVFIPAVFTVEAAARSPPLA